jgi:hypothetical protein
MTEKANIGTTGAKQTSWEERSYRGLVKRIAAENPTAEDEALFHIFAAECAPYFMEIARYAFANALRAYRPRAKGDSVDRSEDIETRAKARLLDYILPNGKMLRDSTFGECATAGGWLTRVSKLGQPGDVVGAVLTEKDVKAVL